MSLENQRLQLIFISSSSSSRIQNDDRNSFRLMNIFYKSNQLPDTSKYINDESEIAILRESHRKS